MSADAAKFDPTSFRDACGAGGPFVLQVEHEDPGLGGRWSLPQPFCVLGSGGRTDIGLDGPEVDRRHLYLQVISGRVFAVDLGTATGTTRDGKPHPHGWIGPDSILEVGPYRITVPDAPGGVLPVDPLASGSRRMLDLPLVQWRIVVGEDPEAEPFAWKMGRVLVLIGSHESCAMRLRGQGIAPFHAALVLTEGGVWAIDLVGQGSIRVNGERVRFARLDEGDTLQIGSITFTPSYEAGFQPQSRPEAAVDDAFQRVDAILTVWTNSLSGDMPGQSETVVSPESFISLTLSALQALRDCQRTQFATLRREIAALSPAHADEPREAPLPLPEPAPTPVPAPAPIQARPESLPVQAPAPPLAPIPSLAPTPIESSLLPAILAPVGTPPMPPAPAPGVGAPLPPLQPLFPPRNWLAPSSAANPAPPPVRQMPAAPPIDDRPLQPPPLMPTGIPVVEEEEEEAAALGMLQRISSAQRERQSPLSRFLNKLIGDG